MNSEFVSLIKFVSASCSGDFNGPDSVLGTTDQISYLRHYFDVYSKEINFSSDRSLIEKTEISNLYNSLPQENFSFRKRKYINEWNCKISNLNDFKFIRLYTKSAMVDGDTIVLKDKNVVPFPAFEIETDNNFNEISFDLTIDSKFFTPIRCEVDTMVPCRNLEFKNGIDEVIKFGFYSNKKVFARIIDKDKYHHTNLYLGDYEFDKENSFNIKFFHNYVIIKFNSNEKVINYSSKLLPNLMFAGSGLHSSGDWKFKILYIKNNDISFDIFEKKSFDEPSVSKQIKLPYVIGGFDNRNNSSILTTTFFVNDSKKKHILHIDEFTPNGAIKINNKLVLVKEDLNECSLDISKYLIAGKNDLEIVLFSRAPENVVSWHRNKDPYFGSSFDGIYIDEVSETFIKNVFAKTISINKEKIEVSIKADINGNNFDNFNIKVSTLDETKIYENAFDKNKYCLIVLDAKPWSFESPNLYKIKVSLLSESIKIDEFELITGFRTIDQKRGSININNKEVNLYGALLMQYLPPLENLVCNHVYANFEQVATQCLIAKKMNCNCLRMHQLGFGTNDKKITKICDFLGIGLIWTTRYQESIYDAIYQTKNWLSKESYQSEMKELINSPSILIWEGSNELYLYREDIDKIYSTFVQAIKEIDDSRLICPVSHLYYGNDSYNRNCQYYQEDGKFDEFWNPCKSVDEWTDPLIIRSAHTYNWLLGYGKTWDLLRKQNWSGQDCLLKSKTHAYCVTEYAIIGRQTPKSDIKVDNNSYEISDEESLGYNFDDNHWFLSQAYQALAATFATRKMLSIGVDGMLWCSLIGGANDLTYLKPVVDFYYRPKLAFYALRDCFKKITAFQDDTDIVWNSEHKIKPVLLTNSDLSTHDIIIELKDEDDNLKYSYKYSNIRFENKIIKLPHLNLPKLSDGYYKYFIIIN